MRRLSGLAALMACALVCVVLAVAAGRVSPPAAAESVIGAGETVLVSPASISPSDDPSGFGVDTLAPVLSGDGLTAAYGTRAGCCSEGGGDEAIHVHDLASGAERSLGDPDQSQTAPSISSDGHLVSFLARDSFSFARDVYVADVSGDEPDVRRVTGLGDSSGDLRFQRQVACDPASVGDSRGDPRCGPRLSADGTALVIPATQSIRSPQLDVFGTTFMVGVDVVDFGPPAEQGTPSRTITVSLFARGHDPIPIDGVTVPEGAFAITSPGESNADLDCTDDPVLDPQDFAADSCAFDVTFDSCGSGTELEPISVDSPMTGGQTELMAFGQRNACPVITEGPGPILALAAVDAASCPQPTPRIDPTGLVPGTIPAVSGPFYDWSLDDVQVGRSVVKAFEIEDDSGGEDPVELQTSDCAIRLVQPAQQQAGTPPPCVSGEPIEGGSCIAYVRFLPTDVRSYGAVLSGPGTDVRFFGAGIRDLLLLKRDPTATGAFTRPGEIVSVNERGVQVAGAQGSGFQPAISADGRFVSFSTDNHGASATRPVGERVLVRDTVARRTALGSVGVPFTGNADESSISGDGRRLAYTTWADDRSEGSHVQVRDLRLGRTVQVSDAPGAASPVGEEAFNRSPYLSLDGSTVAFVSSSPSLAAPGMEPSQQVYVRDLGPDFGGPGTPAVELASPPFDAESDPGRADAPALDATGASIAFISDGELVADPPPLNVAVYARHRFGSTAVAPTSLAFGDQPIGSVGPAQTVTVRNDGPGPSTVDIASSGPFVLTNDCTGVVLHRGESCTFGVASAPTEEGPQSGRETVTTGNPVWEGTVTPVDLTGRSAPAIAQMLVQPESLAFGPQVVGTASAPATVTATNISTLPMSVTAVVGEGATDFVLGPPDPACANLSPGASCRLQVSFIPAALGARAGRLDISGAVGTSVIPRQIPMSGTTATPTLEFSPTVVQEGRVTFLTGENFLPGVPAELQWSAGLTNVRQIVPDAHGRFRTALVLLSGAPRGARVLTVRMPTIGDVKSEPLLVVSRSAQPPDFERD